MMPGMIPVVTSPRSHGMTPRSLPSSPRIHTSAQMTQALVMAGGRETAPPSYGEESVILELTHRLSEQQAEIVAMKNFLERQHHQHQADSAPIGSDAYNTLLAHYMEREEQLRVSKQANGRAIFDLQNERTLNQLKVQDNQEKIAKMEEEVQIQREEVKATDALLKKREVVIDYLQKENADIAAKSKQAIDYLQKENTEVVTKRFLAETAAQKLKDELASYHEMVKKGKTLAEEQIHVLQDNEGAMKDLEDKNDELKEEMEGLKEQLDKTDHTIESKDALLNMQRQQLQEFEDKNLIYEKRFLAKDVDVPKLLARADEGERLWSKIEEREKKYESNEISLGILRDENTSLTADKKRLEAEVDELKQCFEMYDLKLKGTGDKVHMRPLLSQLRDTVQLKEKVVELEEIIQSSGWSVNAADAESDLRKKEQETRLEMEKLTEVIRMLKGQVEGLEEIDVPVLIGKLEEALLVFGYDYVMDGHKNVDELLSQILTAASSDIMSLNTNDSFNDERWAKSNCITHKDFRDFMHPNHYAVVSNLAEGFGSLRREGLCGGPNRDDDDVDEDEGDFADREDIVDNDDASGAESQKATYAAHYGEEAPTEDDGEHDPTDIHIEKVLKIIAQDDEDPDDWRNWISSSQPCSPCSTTTASAE